jgi:hypothetical protein
VADGTGVEDYIAGLAEARKEPIASLRRLILAHLPDGYAEEMGFGMINYVIPLKDYPKTYNGHPLMYAALASHKNYMSLYLMNVYGDTETRQWFTEGFKASGKRLNMGKSCVRFKKLDGLPLNLIGEAIARTTPAEWIATYEAARASMPSSRRKPAG